MLKTLITLVFILVFFLACKRAKKIDNPSGYDLNAPETTKMPAVLNEISGITFNKGEPGTMYAEQDEEGRVFYFSPGAAEVKNAKFGKKGDYEDIAVYKGQMLVLRSEGTLFSFPISSLASGEAGGVQEFDKLLPRGEYEGMYADEENERLYILCKTCSGDNAAKAVTGYVLKFTPEAQLAEEAKFQVSAQDIASLLNKKKISFRPSALAKNRNTNEWYILSSVNKLLVITDEQWQVKQVFPLDAAMFPQPEGIAFDRMHNLYISNERGNLQSATVLKFNYTKEKS